MKAFDRNWCTREAIKKMTDRRKPDFNNLLDVLVNKRPKRPTLFEFFMNDELYLELTRRKGANMNDNFDRACVQTEAYRICGYDYVTLYYLDGFEFKKRKEKAGETISINEDIVITGYADFDEYDWPDVSRVDFSLLKKMEEILPEGMKALICSVAGGLLESAISLVGYNNFCIMIYEQPQLIEDICEKMGSVLVDYYERCASFDSIGALVLNDDWGFNTQTMISPKDMRKYIFPWHKKMVDAIHAKGKPAILHSCGQLSEVYQDIVLEMGYDGKHSYQDAIWPVESAYDQFKGKMAVLGGIDLDYVIRSTPEEIYQRSARMLDHASAGYALGTGNSVPDYVPPENYFAMIAAALVN